MYGMLYAMKEDYEAGLPYLEDAYGTYKNDEGYLSLYSLSLIKIGKSRNDEKMIKKANKMYNKIRTKKVFRTSKKLAAEFS